MENNYEILKKKYPHLFDAFLKSMGLTPPLDELSLYVKEEDLPLVREYQKAKAEQEARCASRIAKKHSTTITTNSDFRKNFFGQQFALQ